LEAKDALGARQRVVDTCSMVTYDSRVLVHFGMRLERWGKNVVNTVFLVVFEHA
jgi:hypothetical protein